MPPPFASFTDPEVADQIVATNAAAAAQAPPPVGPNGEVRPVPLPQVDKAPFTSFIYFSVVHKMLQCTTTISSNSPTELSLQIALPPAADKLVSVISALLGGSVAPGTAMIKITGPHLLYVSKSTQDLVICCRPAGLKLVYWSPVARQKLEASLDKFLQAHMRPLERTWVLTLSEPLKEIYKHQYYLSQIDSKSAMSYSLLERLHDMKRAITSLSHQLMDLVRSGGAGGGGNGEGRGGGGRGQYGPRARQCCDLFNMHLGEYCRWMTEGMGGSENLQLSIHWDDPLAWKPQLYQRLDPASFLYISSQDKWYIKPRLSLQIDGERVWILTAAVEGFDNGLPPDEDDPDVADNGPMPGSIRIAIPESRILFWRTMSIPTFREESSFQLHCIGGEFYHFDHNRDYGMKHTYGLFRAHIRSPQMEDFHQAQGQVSPIAPFTWSELNKTLNRCFHQYDGAYIAYGTFKDRESPSDGEPGFSNEAYLKEAARLVGADARRLVGRLLDTLALNWVKAWLDAGQCETENFAYDRVRYYRLREQWHQMYQSVGSGGQQHPAPPPQTNNNNAPRPQQQAPAGGNPEADKAINAEVMLMTGGGQGVEEAAISRDCIIKYDMARTNYCTYYEP